MSSPPPATVLSYSAGQESTYILYRLGLDPAFRAEYAPGRLVAVMADTGNEHAETYEQVLEAQNFCAEHGIEFHFLGAGGPYHLPSWPSLAGRYRLGSNIGSKSYPKTCTDNLKIRPIYSWLEGWLGREYGVPVGRKRGFYEYAERHGPVEVLIGLAAGEERRVPGPDKGPLWMRRTVRRRYPLIEEGVDRAGCQRYVRAVGYRVPVPSHCRFCPFKTELELLLMSRTDPAGYEEWVGLERNKVEAHRARGVPDDKNFGVWGRKMLPEVLRAAEEKHGHLTTAELEEHRMSHGHCVASRY